MTCPQCGTLNTNDRDECTRCKNKLHSPEMAGKIACANHANREATTSCAACGTRLCAACAVTASGVDFCEADAPANAVRVSHAEDYEGVPVVDAANAAHAGFGSRMTALVIDSLLIFAAAVVLALLFWLLGQSLGFLSSSEQQPVAYWAYRVLLFLGVAIYTILLIAMNGQTVGKQVAGIIVLQPNGNVLSLRASAVRFFVSLISALPLGLGFWWALWDKNSHTWHDKAANTTVFRWEESA